ncbi:MAG: hypothetical protein ACLPSH_12375 [Vulcanimicrobiaceae bacterium]|jgi:hypothetical protein
MTSLEVDGTDLVVEIHGLDRLMAFKNQLRIPLAHVVGVEHAGEEARKWWVGVANPGTYVAWFIKAGTFQTRPWASDRSFWDVRDPKRAILIRLQNDPYVKLVVEVADVEAAIAQVRDALSQAQS